MTNQNLNEKFEVLKDEYIEHNGRILYRIRALRDVGDRIKKGDLGGFVQSELNLSRYDDCWVFPGAKIYDKAFLAHSATLSGLAEVFENAKVGNRARIRESARVYGNARISGFVSGDAQVYGEADVAVFGFAQDESRVHGTASLCHWGEGAYGNDDIASREEFLVIEKLRYSRWAEFQADQQRRKKLRYGW